MKNLIILFLLASLTLTVKAQDKKHYPEIGKPMTSFVFKNIDNYYSKQLSNYDLKGKYTILDFWNAACVPCIESMPKMNTLQHRFKNELKIIFVGEQWKALKIEDLYKHISKKYNLDMISIYDSLYYRRIVPFSVPHLIWINQEGIIKAITSKEDVTEENISRFISGQDFLFKDRSFKGKTAIHFDRTKPLLVNGNGGADTSYLFRSVLSHSLVGSTDIEPIESALRYYPGQTHYQIVRATLKELYQMAYFGTYSFKANNISKELALNCVDSSLFSFDYAGNGKGLYNYSIAVPKGLASPKRIMRDMQLDLYKYFGFQAEVVERPRPYLAVVIIDSIKVKRMLALANNGSKKFKWHLDSEDIEITNYPANALWGGYISKFLPGNPIVYNETGLSDKTLINMEFKAIADNLESVRKGLQQFGLDLKPSTKMMKTLVVSDPKN